MTTLNVTCENRTVLKIENIETLLAEGKFKSVQSLITDFIKSDVFLLKIGHFEFDNGSLHDMLNDVWEYCEQRAKITKQEQFEIFQMLSYNFRKYPLKLIANVLDNKYQIGFIKDILHAVYLKQGEIGKADLIKYCDLSEIEDDVILKEAERYDVFVYRNGGTKNGKYVYIYEVAK